MKKPRPSEASQPQRDYIAGAARSEDEVWVARPAVIATTLDEALKFVARIYNAPIVWNSVNWGLKCDGWEFMFIPLASQVGLATWDFNRLTTLVFACHQARVRLMVGPYGVGGMILRFSRRNATSSFYEGHPNLQEAVAAFWKYVSADHPITYTEPEPQ